MYLLITGKEIPLLFNRLQKFTFLCWKLMLILFKIANPSAADRRPNVDTNYV